MVLCGSLCMAESGKRILEQSGITGGLIVHLDCNDGQLTSELLGGDGYAVHGVDTSPADVVKARKHLLAKGVYGQITVAQFDGKRRIEILVGRAMR